MKRRLETGILQVLRVALVVMFAGFFAFQSAPSAAAFQTSFADVEAMASPDCAAQQANQPANQKSHATHCCIVCNHPEADRLLSGFIFTYSSFSIGLAPGEPAQPPHFQHREPRPPYSGWATSWSSQAPPPFS